MLIIDATPIPSPTIGTLSDLKLGGQRYWRLTAMFYHSNNQQKVQVAWEGNYNNSLVYNINKLMSYHANYFHFFKFELEIYYCILIIEIYIQQLSFLNDLYWDWYCMWANSSIMWFQTMIAWSKKILTIFLSENPCSCAPLRLSLLLLPSFMLF